MALLEHASYAYLFNFIMLHKLYDTSIFKKKIQEGHSNKGFTVLSVTNINNMRQVFFNSKDKAKFLASVQNSHNKVLDVLHEVLLFLKKKLLICFQIFEK